MLGRRETAAALLRRRPDLRIEGRFEARASVLVTGGADVDTAIPDVLASAFGAPAADPLRARQLVLLGGIARSRRFRSRLADAVRTLRAGHTGRAGSNDPLDLQFGPLPAPPGAAGLRALTELDPGEEWLVEPERLDDAGLLWRPGVRWGVKRSARFWRDSIGMPVLGVTHARSLDEAIAIQNDAGSGGAAAIHSLDADEILPWLERVEAASLAVCRPTTGARIEQRPVGGWNDAGLGIGSLAGGPNRLLALGSWSVREGTQSATLHLRGLDPEVQLLIEAAQEALDYTAFDRVRRAALSDALTWRTSLGIARDAIGLGIERNLVRHWPVATQLRLAEAGSSPSSSACSPPPSSCARPSRSPPGWCCPRRWCRCSNGRGSRSPSNATTTGSNACRCSQPSPTRRAPPMPVPGEPRAEPRSSGWIRAEHAGCASSGAIACAPPSGSGTAAAWRSGPNPSPWPDRSNCSPCCASNPSRSRPTGTGWRPPSRPSRTG
ncbi:aldehyde dehydrogenase family protein [Leucobacter sp. HNU]|uniref:aldehyde dehydrogenase family protein n=1 Tax=Leucobacter sp. HNU TaxID=3236805 RepID=UPI003A7FE63E